MKETLSLQQALIDISGLNLATGATTMGLTLPQRKLEAAANVSPETSPTAQDTVLPANVISVNAGGTSTDIDWIKFSGSAAEIVAHRVYPPGNYRTAGPDAVPGYIAAALKDFRIERTKDLGIVLGVAGAGLPGAVESLTLACEKLGFLTANIRAGTDVQILLEALQTPTGVVVISGTGSVVKYRAIRAIDKERIVLEGQIGGHGHAFGDRGSASAIGRDAVTEAVMEWETKPYGATKLIHALKEYCNGILREVPASGRDIVVEPRDVQDIFLGVREKLRIQRFARFAPRVLAAADEGDKIASHVVASAVRDLERQTAGALHSLGRALTEKGLSLGGEPTVIGLHGGIFKNPLSKNLIIKPLEAGLRASGFNIKLLPLGIEKGDNSHLFNAIRNLFPRQAELLKQMSA